MAIKLSQNLKQSQTLLMTPQLQQAIKMLTLTHMEMANVIAHEMTENPLLEERGGEDIIEKTDDPIISSLEREVREADPDNLSEQPLMTNKDDNFDWQKYVDTYESGQLASGSFEKKSMDDAPNYENMVSKGETLAEHLETQLRMDNLDEEEWRVASFIIGNINEDGYLATPFEKLLEVLDVKEEDALYILEKIQNLDPIGCGSRDLTDCLLAQAKILEDRSPVLEKIIKNHLEDIKTKDFSKIVKETGNTLEEVNNAIEGLNQFNPKPGRLISPADVQYVIPDVYVIEVSGEFVVAVNEEGIPRLKVSNIYKDLMNQEAGGTEVKDYVQDKLRNAVWLIKSIEKRQKTIYRVAEAIVKHQQEFFKKGVEFLKPLTLKKIADEIGVHESTVSRVTTNKFMHSPLGVFELKYFFMSGIGGKSGDEISSEVLKFKIKNLIELENAHRPLSDQKIAELLKREGIEVARRTVAKYREALGILSSSKRKIK
jgi:RNA polymerase sigma-54 factor